MAVILPILGAIALGGSLTGAAIAVVVALGAVGLTLCLSVRHGERVSAAAFSESDEVNLLTILGTACWSPGLPRRSTCRPPWARSWSGSASRARLPIVPRRCSRRCATLRSGVLRVLRAVHGSLGPARRGDPGHPARGSHAGDQGGGGLVRWPPQRHRRAWSVARSGAAGSRGEFSIIIAALGVTAGGSGRLSAIAAGYVLLTATLGPVLARVVDGWPAASSSPERGPAVGAGGTLSPPACPGAGRVSPARS